MEIPNVENPSWGASKLIMIAPFLGRDLSTQGWVCLV